MSEGGRIIEAMLRSIGLIVIFSALAFAQEDAIRSVMKASEDAWNRGDLVAFASYYEDAPQTTFMGAQVVKGGNRAILERYRKSYGTREKMGALTFSEIEVRPLATGVALVTGKFELKRTTAGGGPVWGRYTLVMKETKGGWKIIHDHSSSY
jgi:uncharacterized protein (TIGR02246 family)